MNRKPYWGESSLQISSGYGARTYPPAAFANRRFGISASPRHVTSMRCHKRASMETRTVSSYVRLPARSLLRWLLIFFGWM